MMKNGSSALTLVFVMLASLSCGGGGGGGTGGSSGAGTGGSAAGTGGRSGTGGSSGAGGATAGSPLHVSCMAYCVADDKCKAETTVADCVSYTCPPAGESNSKDALPASCQSAWIAYWDCLAKSADVCDKPGSCTTQAAAFADACP